MVTVLAAELGVELTGPGTRDVYGPPSFAAQEGTGEEST